MTYATYYEGKPPVPRVQHCPPGSRVTLAGEAKARTIDHIRDHHAVCTDGLIVTLCHPVREDCMQFGDGAGWRPLSTRSVHNPMDNPRTPDARPCNSDVGGCLVTELS